jgi:hypothetical protein
MASQPNLEAPHKSTQNISSVQSDILLLWAKTGSFACPPEKTNLNSSNQTQVQNRLDKLDNGPTLASRLAMKRACQDFVTTSELTQPERQKRAAYVERVRQPETDNYSENYKNVCNQESWWTIPPPEFSCDLSVHERPQTLKDHRRPMRQIQRHR